MIVSNDDRSTNRQDSEYNRWRDDENRRRDDSIQDPPQSREVLHDKMESGVENERLRDDHEEPTDVNESDGSISIVQDVEIRDQYGQRLGEDSPGAENAAPEVQSLSPLEEEEDADVELDADVPSYACKCTYCHGRRQIGPQVVSESGSSPHIEFCLSVCQRLGWIFN